MSITSETITKDKITPVWETPQVTVYLGDCLKVLRQLPDESVNCCITSPPYFGLRDYKMKNQIGLEATLPEYIAKLVAVFAEIKRVLKVDGTCWLNLGDSYSTHRSGKCDNPMGKSKLAGTNTQTNARSLKENREDYRNSLIPEKNLLMVPHRVAIALQDAGWYVRSDIVWEKGNPMPESVSDRCTRSHEYIFLLAKSAKYYYNAEAIKEKLAENSDVAYRQQLRANVTYNSKAPYQKNFPKSFDTEKRNARSVWKINTIPFPGSHFAVFPPELPRRCISAGCPDGGVVLDPFSGSGTTLMVAQELGRRGIGIELNPDYLHLIEQRCRQLTIFGAMERSL